MNRVEAVMDALPGLRVKPAHALRESWRSGYSWRELRRDVLAGLVVGVIALPLSMALAIASGVPPQHGLYTAIVAGGLIALLGGSRVQVSGPTAAFVVILAPISAKFGLAGLMMASVMAGVLLVLMGFLRLGTLIEFIPYPVTTGFTAGIAVVIATLQMKDFLGLSIEHLPEQYIEKVAALTRALPTFRWPDVALGVATLAALVGLPRITRRVPAALIALPLAAVAAVVLARIDPQWTVATIFSRFPETNGVPQQAPAFAWPWSLDMVNAAGEVVPLDFSTFRSLMLAAFAIAMLGAIESLLSAVVSDGMTGFKHDPNAELVAQGVGNVAAPFFGGFAATGAIARTATNVRSGGRTPVASMVHALFILVSVLVLAPWLGYVPMASMAALLLIVAKNMSEAKHFLYVLRIGPKSDVAVLLLCFALTVIFDMVVAVSAGIVCASLLFMGRMAEVSGVKLVGDKHPVLAEPLPQGVLLYEVNGPLFFGAAHKAMSALHEIGNGVKVVILDMENVPAIDATGLVNLQSTISRLHREGIFCVLGGVQPQPMEVLDRAQLEEIDSRIGIFESIAEAVTMARFRLAMWEDLRQPVPSPAR